MPGLRKMITKVALFGGGAKPPPAEFSDDFARADGAVANDWVGATWEIASHKIINTPNLSVDKLTDGGFENWDSATDLTSWDENLVGASTINQESVDIYAGTYAARMDIDASHNPARLIQVLSYESNKRWVEIEVYAKATGAGYVYGQIANMGSFTGLPVTTDYAKLAITAMMGANSGARGLYFMPYSGLASQAVYWDAAVLKWLTSAELFLTRPQYPTADYILELTLSDVSRGSKAGIVFALDDPSNPQNYAVAQVDGGAVSLWEFVSGARSSVLIADGNPKTTDLVSEGDKLKIVKSGTSVKVYYNDVAVSTAKTLNAALENNKYAGAFSTRTGNQFSGWSETVSVDGGDDSFLDAFFP